MSKVKTSPALRMTRGGPELPTVQHLADISATLDRLGSEFKPGHGPLGLTVSGGETCASLIRDTCALDLFCETGLPREAGFAQEAFHRISHRLLPQPPYDGDVGTLRQSVSVLGEAGPFASPEARDELLSQEVERIAVGG